MRLGPRTQSRLLWMLTFTILGGTIALTVQWARLPAPDVRLGMALPNAQASAAGSDDTSTSAPSADFQALAQLASIDLRRPLFDPPPQVEPTAPPRPLPTLHLLGTIVNGEQSAALVADRTGRAELHHIGDRMGPDENPVRLVAIEAGQITVEHGDRRHTVKQEDAAP